MSDIKEKVSKVVIATTAFMCVAGSAFATGVADESVVTGFTTIKDDVVATLSAVAPLGLGIMGIFLAWRYGHRIFKTVAK